VDPTAPTGLKRSRSGEGQNIVLALVAAFFVIMALGRLFMVLFQTDLAEIAANVAFGSAAAP
jgi:hypothetical protein